MARFVTRSFPPLMPLQLQAEFDRLGREEREISEKMASKAAFRVRTLCDKNGLVIRADQVFDDDASAENWLKEETNPIGPAVAVKVRSPLKAWKNGFCVFEGTEHWHVGAMC